MSVEIADAVGVPEQIETKTQSCNDEPVNGVSNGHHGSSKHRHKSSSKDKHKDKVRDKEHKSSSKSSSSRDKHSSSSSSRDKEKEKDKHHGSSSSKEKEKDRDKHKSSSSSGHHKSSSSSSHRDKDRDRHKDKEKKESSRSGGDKEKERRKEHKSSSSRDKDKDRHHKSSSSSSKNKHSSSSRSSSSKEKKDLENSEVKFLKPDPIIRENGDIAIPDNISNIPRNDYDESCSGYEASNLEHKYNGYQEVSHFKQEQEINISQASSCDYSMSQFKADEPAFVIKEEEKEEASDEYDDNDGSTFKQESISTMDQTNESDEEKDNMPLSKRKVSAKVVYKEEEDEDDIPLSKRKKTEFKEETDEEDEQEEEDDDDDDDYDSEEEDIPLLERKKLKAVKKEVKIEKSTAKKKKDQSNDEKTKKRKGGNDEIKPSPSKRQKKQEGEEENEVWRWWEEEKRADGVKWTTLEHKGPVFAPPYEPLPKNVHFYYDGKPMKLSETTEEVATFYARMLNHDYVTKSVFNDNFFKDFRKTMTSHEREVIKDLKKCNFDEMFQYFTAEAEKRKSATKEEKNAKKAENEALVKEYGFCIIDGHKEKIGNFKLEPPGLFRGRGEHPKMGMVKRRIVASDVSINCGKDSKIPVPPKGQKWKDVRHDNTVTWLASWIENVQGQVKYIMLNPSSKLKGEKDHIKYETARKLDKHINKIRTTYREEWKSKEMRVRQRAVALYFIDKLALRAGNEKDEDQADTVGCCSLRVEHVSLHKQLNGKENVVVFDFLGKDSIRYYNEVEVEKRVFKNLELFMENKKDGDDLFDRLNTQVLNEHLKELMDGLTAKVFRTYNASITLQAQLDELTDPNSTIPEKLLSYNRANRAVAILCNHQRSVPKGHAKSMENLKEKIKAKREAIDDAEVEYHDLKKAAKRGSVKERLMADKKQKQIERLKEQLKKLELQETDRDENKTIALGTSKLNYLDPRISVAWCKKHGVQIEKIFNKTQREKFRWAIHMADKNYRF